MFNFLKKKEANWRAQCGVCSTSVPTDKLTKLTWRYQHKTKKYSISGRSFIITGYKYMCPRCLKRFTMLD